MQREQKSTFQPDWFFNWGGGGFVTNPGYSYILIGNLDFLVIKRKARLN